MNKLVWGVGVNDLDYRTQVKEYVTENGGKRIRKHVFTCKYYEVWKDMLKRCYSEKYLESRPSYIGTSVCSEWLSASAFKKWMEQQDWRDKSLDKDRERSSRTSGHAERSREARKTAKKLSAKERSKRAKKAWKTRKRLYGKGGTA
jgi:hypothetical protein